MVVLGKAPDGRVESEFKDLADVVGIRYRMLLLDISIEVELPVF